MKRFAIQFPNGLFSNGPECRPVVFEKAKLWRLRNHVTAHLGRWSANPYPAGTKVVWVELSHTVTPIYSVSEYMNKKKKADAIKKAKRDKHWAERGVSRAKRDLKIAEDAASVLRGTK